MTSTEVRRLLAPRPGPSSCRFLDTEDAREGVASFLERRRGRFVGR